jgi:DNA helicase-2/ATP-dependent DNA helicase PcrA
VLMTMHNAKGLEFPVVFVTGLEDGLFPLARAYDDPRQLEEERRLCYVGITRAEQKLFLSWAEQRRRNGELLQSKPSSFLAAIPQGMLEERKTIKLRSSGRGSMYGGAFMSGSGRGSSWSATGATGAARGRDRYDDLLEDLPRTSAASRRPGHAVSRAMPDEDASQDAAVIAIGARVKHRMFGSGTVAELSGAGASAKVKVDFDDETIGRKTLVVGQANLERGWD